MKWIVFSHSLPSKSNSSLRVTLWRRLRRFGAISLKTGVYVLPARDECIEAFQWLSQEVYQAKGEAILIHVDRFDGLADSQVIGLFQATREQDYSEVDERAQTLENKLFSHPNSSENPQSIKDELIKLRKRYNEILSIDFFSCPESSLVASRLTKIERSLIAANSFSCGVLPTAITEYVNKSWVTRPRPFVDRMACVWLIRRFINPNATIRYSLQPAPDEVAFDMPDAEFGHTGNLCSFETMLHRFGLTHPTLLTLSEFVHELDLRDGLYNHPQIAGVEAVLRGWLLLGFSDSELELRALELFDGLYALLSQQLK